MHILREWRGRVYRTSQSDGFFESDEWFINRRVVFDRDHYTCQRCDKRFKMRKLTCHHMQPRDSGGSDDVSNLLTLCEPCHDFVEIQGFHTKAEIIGSFDDRQEVTPTVTTGPDDDDPYHRPEWHRYVYGGRRHSANR